MASSTVVTCYRWHDSRSLAATYNIYR